MRRRLVGGGGAGIAFGVAQPVAEFADQTPQSVDLLPLCGHGLVQRLDGDFLIGDAGFQCIDALAQPILIIHD